MQGENRVVRLQSYQILATALFMTQKMYNLRFIFAILCISQISFPLLCTICQRPKDVFLTSKGHFSKKNVLATKLE